MTYSLDIDGNDQTPYVRDQSITCKFNTLDLVLIDPAYPPKVGDVLTQFDPDWDGDVVRVEITDAAEKGAHTLFNISATNTDPLVTATAPFNLSDTPNGSTTFGYKNLSTVVTKTTDATVSATETTGRCTVFEPGLRAGMTIALTSVNHGYAAQSFTINQVTVRYPAKETDPAFEIEFGDTLKPLSQLIHNPAPNCDDTDPGGVGSAVGGAQLFCVTGTAVSTCGPTTGANECRRGSLEGSSGTTTGVAPGFYYSSIRVTTRYGNTAIFKVRVKDSHAIKPNITTTLATQSLVKCGLGGNWTTLEGVFEVPAGYDQVEFLDQCTGGLNTLAGSHTFSAYTLPSDAVNDPFCLVDGPGTSPYQMMSDDPRLTLLQTQMAELLGQVGLSWKPPVRVATTAAGTLASSFEAGDTVDGVVLVVGDRILIKDQAAGADNGIYVVASSGTPARSADFDADGEAVGAACVVSEGTANGNKVFTCTTDEPITLGTTALVFAALSAGGSVATDTIWDAKGDLAGGTGADTAAKLTVGANGTFLLADSTQTTGLKWSTNSFTAAAYISDNYQPDAYPGSPNTVDDEFEGGGALDAKWTKVNDPAGADAFNQTDFAGFLHVGLTELGTDNFANALQLYQTAPTGTAVATYTAKLALTLSGDGLTVTDAGEFAAVGIALINSVNSEAVGVGIQLNDAVSADTDLAPLSVLGFQELYSGLGLGVSGRVIPTSDFVYLRLRKSTASAYTSSNTYLWDWSLNGVIWQNIGQSAKTFTTACDRVGIFLRRPKSATGTPYCEALVDFFRRTV